MATDQVWTWEFLSDSAWAFGQVLARATAVKLNATELESLHRVQEWLDRVSPLLSKTPVGAGNIAGVPPLNVTVEELHTLVTKVVIQSGRTASQRRQLAGQWRPVEQLHRQLGWLIFTSVMIATALAVAAAINLTYLILFRDVSRTTVIKVNLALLTVLLGIWAVHHFVSLRRHTRDFDAHLVAVADRVGEVAALPN